MEQDVRVDGDDSHLVRLEITYHEACVLVDLMHGPVSTAQRKRKGQESTLLLTSVYRKALDACEKGAHPTRDVGGKGA